MKEKNYFFFPFLIFFMFEKSFYVYFVYLVVGTYNCSMTPQLIYMGPFIKDVRVICSLFDAPLSLSPFSYTPFHRWTPTLQLNFALEICLSYSFEVDKASFIKYVTKKRQFSDLPLPYWRQWSRFLSAVIRIESPTTRQVSLYWDKSVS